MPSKVYRARPIRAEDALRAAERDYDYHETLHDFAEPLERLFMIVVLVMVGGAPRRRDTILLDVTIGYLRFAYDLRGPANHRVAQPESNKLPLNRADGH